MEHYSVVSELFIYPDKEKLVRALSRMYDILSERYPTAVSKLDEFNAFVKANSNNFLKEYYIKTFDVMPFCYMDLGYVLFGEDYRRGEFLVNLLNEHVKAANDCGKELSDHLPNMLKLLPKMADRQLAQELMFSIMIPALKEMVKNFIDNENVYKRLLEILIVVMEDDSKGLEYPQIQILCNDKSNFLNKVCGKRC